MGDACVGDTLLGLADVMAEGFEPQAFSSVPRSSWAEMSHFHGWMWPGTGVHLLVFHRYPDTAEHYQAEAVRASFSSFPSLKSTLSLPFHGLHGAEAAESSLHSTSLIHGSFSSIPEFVS